VTVNIARRKTLKTFVGISFKNSGSVLILPVTISFLVNINSRDHFVAVVQWLMITSTCSSVYLNIYIKTLTATYLPT
jgi:hypothetical protein